MLCGTLNLGIVAHVDAGKTTLTERLLYAAGVIDAPGSVDRGSTQTDSLALERQRGITIKSTVVSFALDGVTVNLIDTPGHPDFIAEVERVLGVLDGAVLVVSAVEGVQPQTPLLMRALQRLAVPTLVFVNKIDRRGADRARVLRELRERLALAAVPLGTVREEGTPRAAFVPGAEDAAALVEALAEHDDRLLTAYLEDGTRVSPALLHDALAAQTRRGRVHPVVFGSALTGAGVEELAGHLRLLLPAGGGDSDGPVSASVFKVERGAGGEKVAYARLFAGTIRVRDAVRHGDGELKVTAIATFDGADAVRSASVAAGQIAKLWGLDAVRIGDSIGEPPPRTADRRAFAPPTLESVVVPRRAADRRALHVALSELAEADPLIGVRLDEEARELSVVLYGEVQKQVIEATLAADHGLEVEFRETTTVHVERPAATGEAVEVLHAPTNPFLATIGLRVEPAPAESGVRFEVAVDPRSLPLYLYKTTEGFTEHMEEYVRGTLREGLFGWAVTDCVVTLTRCAYSVPDGPPSRRGPLSTSADFRKLTPLVLMQALRDAGTVVCEPVVRAGLDVPAPSLGAVASALARLGGAVDPPSVTGSRGRVDGTLAVARLPELRRRLPGLTGGEGVLETAFAGYRPVVGDPPTRRRTTPNPLNRGEYLLHLARRVGGG